jgi:glycogen operon protein
MGRTQRGNNNAYCQDNRTSWVDWERLESNRSLYRFFKLLIQFRKAHELLRYDSFTVRDGFGAEIDWHGFRLGEPDWSDESRCLAMHLSGNTGRGRAEDIYLMANAHWEAHDFALPAIHQGCWRRFVDTACGGDYAIAEPDALLQVLDHDRYHIESRSIVVLISQRNGG